MKIIVEGILQGTLTVSCAAAILLLFRKKLNHYWKPAAVLWVFHLLFLRLALPVPFRLLYRAVMGPGLDLSKTNFTYVSANLAKTEGGRYLNLRPDMLRLMFWIWCAGAAAYLSVCLLQYWHTARKLKNSSSLSGDLLEYGRKAGIDVPERFRRIQVRCSPLVKTPVLAGYLRRQLYLPEGTDKEGELELILLHEMIHHRRKDLWIKLGYTLAGGLHWFNPLVYILRRAADQEMEIVCDRETAGKLGEEKKAEYAELLLGWSGKEPCRRGRLEMFLSSGARGLEERLRNIFSTKKKKPGWLLFGVFFLAVLFLQPAVYFEIQAEPYQDSYIDIQKVIGGFAKIERLSFGEFYCVHQDGTGEKVGDQEEICLEPLETVTFHLPEHAVSVQSEEDTCIDLRFHITEKARLQISLTEGNYEETTDTEPGAFLVCLEPGKKVDQFQIRNESSHRVYLY